jgi:hypothetical protein
MTDLLNDRVVPFFDSQEVKLLRMLTDRGSEYCGNPERVVSPGYNRSAWAGCVRLRAIERVPSGA